MISLRVTLIVLYLVALAGFALTQSDRHLAKNITKYSKTRLGGME